MLVGVMCLADEREFRQKQEQEFKQKLMSQVGKEFTASGKLQAGKFGWWLNFDGLGVYIKTQGTNSLAPENALKRYHNKKVTVTGILHCQPERRSDNPLVSGIPEHFFFDAGQCRVTEAKESIK